MSLYTLFCLRLCVRRKRVFLLARYACSQFAGVVLAAVLIVIEGISLRLRPCDHDSGVGGCSVLSAFSAVFKSSRRSTSSSISPTPC